MKSLAFAANSARLHSDSLTVLGIEIGPSKDDLSDGVGLEILRTARKRVCHDG